MNFPQQGDSLALPRAAGKPRGQLDPARIEDQKTRRRDLLVVPPNWLGKPQAAPFVGVAVLLGG